MYKVLQINSVYGYGSTGKITKDLHNSLKKKGFQSVVLYGRRQKSTQEDVIKTCTEFEAKAWNVISRFTGKPYAVAPIGTRKLISILKREQPDIVHLQCINGFFVDIYKLLNYLKKEKIPTVLTLHAEFMYTGNCGHALECNQWKMGCKRCPDKKRALRSYILAPVQSNWMKMKKAFESFEMLTVCPVSEWVKMRVQQSFIFKQYPICTVFNGIDTNAFFYDQQIASALREELQLVDKKIILHVTANYQNPEKGGNYITKLSQHLDRDKYCLIVVDGNDNSPPEDFAGLYWGRAKNQEELAALYMAADVMTITSSRETFSMTCAESLCCGTPAVCFDFHDGYGKSSFPEQYVKMVPFGQLDQLKNEIEMTVAAKVDKEKISSECREIFSCEKMTEDYIQIYQSLMNMKKGERGNMV